MSIRLINNLNCVLELKLSFQVIHVGYVQTLREIVYNFEIHAVRQYF